MLRKGCLLYTSLRRQIDVAVEVELNRDRRRAERAEGSQLADAGDLAELPLERRRHLSLIHI